LSVRLVGQASNRDAVGAVVTLSVGDRVWIRQRVGGGSYASTNDSAIHFGVPGIGLGQPATEPTLKVDWPSGQTSILEVEKLNSEILIIEPNETG
jgi:hypothetical protein